MSAAQVARVGYNAMLKRKRVVIAGFWNKIRMLATPLAPRRMLAYFARKYHELQPQGPRIANDEGPATTNE